MPLFSSKPPNDTDKPGRKTSGKLRLYRAACRLVLIWLIVLFIGAFVALVGYWMKDQYQYSIVHQPPQNDIPEESEESSDINSADFVEDSTLIAGLKPRTVEQMINESYADDDDGPVILPESPVVPAPDHHNIIAEVPDSNGVDMPDALSTLLKEARYAQIEGDIRRSIIKLEQASEIAPNHPVLCYYFGVAYEFLRNAPKAREYFAKVVAQKSAAGKFYDLAAIHLERGFTSPADKRGDISFGTILEFREENTEEGQHVVLTIPVLMKEGLNIRPEDLYIPIHFFDAVNGNKSIDLTRAEEPEYRWISEPVDWEDGEEILEVEYFMPRLTEEELSAYGDLKYYGYTAKLYYKGEPMDCHATPSVLFLIEQMKQNKSGYPGFYENDNLLPDLDALPVSESPMDMPFDPGNDNSLLPP